MQHSQDRDHRTHRETQVKREGVDRSAAGNLLRDEVAIQIPSHDLLVQRFAYALAMRGGVERRASRKLTSRPVEQNRRAAMSLGLEIQIIARLLEDSDVKIKPSPAARRPVDALHHALEDLNR